MPPRSPIVKLCSACQEKITDKNIISCKSDTCDKTFHLLCISTKNLTSEHKAIWICPDCHAASRKGGDNSLTPVRQNPQTDGITSRTRSRLATEQSFDTNENDFNTLRLEMRLMREDMSSIRKDLAEAVSSLAKYHDRLDELTFKVKQLNTVQEENVMLRATISDLQQQLNLQAQLHLGNEIEISGIHEYNNENLQHIVLTTASKIGVQLVEEDIDDAARVGPRRRADDGMEEQEHANHSSRPIVVRFTRKAKRNEFMKSAKSRRITTKDVTVGPEKKIYVNERLTRPNRLLFREARIRAKLGGFKHCWTRNGFIHVRKRDGVPPQLIRSAGDLDHIFGVEDNTNF